MKGLGKNFWLTVFLGLLNFGFLFLGKYPNPLNCIAVSVCIHSGYKQVIFQQTINKQKP